ncbi:hypothetical protein [Maridesulfovibrio sp.]|uniref:hypothetical protein n=1 Tax=Maridesulfovibrio sp. TaxID=2795000 RepID=UPI0029CA38F7|nr:hypothetical protein [Maridesulfovibrio sp.]
MNKQHQLHEEQRARLSVLHADKNQVKGQPMKILPAVLVMLSMICFGCASAPVQAQKSESYRQT